MRGACWRLAVLAGLAALSGGCHKNPPLDRVAVDGRVTLDGAPLEVGSIQFIPSGTGRGPKAGAMIRGGSFALPQSRGPIAGALRVEIRAPKVEPGQVLPAEESQLIRLIAESAERLPPHYNKASKLEATATHEGPNHFTFELTTAP